MTRSEELLCEILMDYNIPELPEAIKEGDTKVWVDAIATLTMRNMSTGYAYVRNIPGKYPRVMKLYGSGGIGEIRSLHPVSFLSDNYAPPVNNMNSLKAYVARRYKETNERVDNLTKDELITAAYAIAIQTQAEKAVSKQAIEEMIEKKFEEKAKENIKTYRR